MGKLWWVFNTFQTVSSGNLRWVPDLRPSHGNFSAYDKASKLIFTQKMYSAVFKLFVFDWIHFDMITPIYNRTHTEMVNIQIQFKVDRLQIIVVAKKYIYVSQLFISRMPKMRAIPQLVSAPLNPTPIAEHFRRSNPPYEHSRRQHI